VHIPYRLFQALLATYAIVNKHPPFTTKQLAALVIPETFEVIDWPTIFGVPATPLRKAMLETFRDPTYANITLDRSSEFGSDDGPLISRSVDPHLWRNVAEISLI
jgi:hypothetical protein